MNNRKTLSGCSFGILGDSYSTFQGFIPEDYNCYYPRPDMVKDVLSVEDTWWHRLMQKYGMQLVINDSYSGSTVCTQVRENYPKASAFTHRAKTVFDGSVPMDYIFVFGGTNDNWLERPAGQLQFGHWTEEDLEQVLPAYCCILHYITVRNPGTTVVTVINTGLKPDIAEGLEQAGIHYGAVIVKPAKIEKNNGHPNAQGMCDIAQAVEDALQ